MSALTTTEDPPDRIAALAAQLGAPVDHDDPLAFAAEDLREAVDARDLVRARGAWSEVARFLREATPGGGVTLVNAADWLNEEPADPDQVLQGIFDRGDKVAVIGGSKRRKSFFIAQLALQLASGRDFLSWHVSKPRRVLCVQMEIASVHYHRRIRGLARDLVVSPNDLGDRLGILNTRGHDLSGAEGVERIAEMAGDFKPEVIILDPLYKLLQGDENLARDMKPVLAAFDRLAEEMGAAVVYAHHDAKGASGEKDIRDRGAGSGVLGRDYDAAFSLSSHAVEEDAVVVDVLVRNYRPTNSITIVWKQSTAPEIMAGGYRFEWCPEMEPIKATGRDQQSAAKRTHIEQHVGVATQMLQKGPMPIAVYKDNLATQLHLSTDRVRALVATMVAGDTPRAAEFEERARGRHSKVIGLPGDIAQLREKATKHDE